MSRRTLKATKVYRGGKTARSRIHETDDVTLNSEGSYRLPPATSFSKKNVLTLEFSMTSKGGGTTVAHIAVGQVDFPALLKTMVEVDRQRAMAAISSELARQLK